MKKNRYKPTSFICEHTAEYILTGKLRDLFKLHHLNPFLLYFSGNREGSKIAKICMTNISAKICFVFARRPKIRFPRDETVTLKVNRELFIATEIAEKYAIPVLVGAPLVNELKNLTDEAPCVWFCLNSRGFTARDIEFKISILNSEVGIELPPEVRGPLNENEIPKVLMKSPIFSDWQEIVNIAMEIKKGEFYRFFGSLYKPFIIVLPISHEK